MEMLEFEQFWELKQFNFHKVKAFHKKYYHPSNACVIVCGIIDLKQLFAAIQPVIEKLSSQQPENNPCDRPWLSEDPYPVPDVTSPITKTIQFPSDDEDGGDLVLVGFLGPPLLSREPTEEHTNLEEMFAILLLLKLLTKSTVSPLHLDFVEKEDPLASHINFTFGEYTRSLIFFELDGVTDKEKVISQLRSSLEKQLDNFDMSHMETTLQLSIQTELTALENHPHSYVAQAVTRDFLYGISPSTFTNRLNGISTLTNFLQKPAEFWTDLVRNHILTPNWVTIFAEPSSSLQQDLYKQEADRIIARREILGSGGLASNALRLDQAILSNSKSIPKNVMKKVKVPSLRNIQFHRINRIKNPSWIFTSEFPANIFLDDITTNFFYAAVLTDTTTLGGEFRQYLPLFAEVFLNSPMLKVADGNKTPKVIIPYEHVITDRERDLLVCELNVGLELTEKSSDDDDGALFMTRFSCGSFSHLLTLGLQMELGKVEVGMDWIRKMFWTTHWQMERIKAAANKLLGDVLHVKRSACQMCPVIVKQLIYQEDSNVAKMSPLSQLKLFQDMCPEDDLEFARSENEIRTAFDSILSVITDPSNVSLHLSGDIKKVRDNLDERPVESLGNLLRRSFPFERTTTKVERHLASSPDKVWMYSRQKLEERSTLSQIIFGLTSTNTSYLSMVCPGPTSFQDSDLPGILTAIQYFTQVEGPLHHSIRGNGYALWYDLIVKVNEGLIYFELSRCSDVVGAYRAAQAVIMDYMSKSSKHLWSEELLASAKSSLIFEWLETEKTPLAMASSSCLAYYRSVSGNYVQELIRKISKVSVNNVRELTRKYLSPLFHDQRSNYASVVVCPLNQVKDIKKGMSQLGKYNMRIAESYQELEKIIYNT